MKNKEKGYEEAIEFKLVTQLGIPKVNDDFKLHLPKGKYDIDYVIQLCKIIENKCYELRFDPRGLEFTLRSSLKALRCMLETEKSVTPAKRPVILWHCSKCNETELIFSDLSDAWQCNFCNPKLLQ